MKQRTQTFNDGIASIYSIKNIAEDGDLPKYEFTLKVGSLRYEERTVGMSRFWTAKQDSTLIDIILRLPRIEFVKRCDVVVPIDGEQYEIKQIQYPKDVDPPSMDLSLERLEVAYEII